MEVDKKLFISVVILITVGIVFSLSLPVFTVIYYNYNEYHFFIRQLIVGMLSIFVIWGLSRLNPDVWLHRIGISLFLISMFMMIIMHFLPESFITSAGGARRWIRFPGFSIAPVEFFKVGFVYFLAWSFSRRLLVSKEQSLKEELYRFLPYIIVFGFVIFLIAFLQNDLGQVIVLGMTLAFMAFFAGTSTSFFITGILLAIVIFVIAITTSQHRILRIKLWWGNVQDMVLSIFPESVASVLRIQDVPEPYQIYHSLNAINSGGVFGLGIGNGVFKLGYLSEVHTDFALAGIAEEIGLVGVLFITITMFFMIFRVVKIANRSESRVYYLFCLGIGLILTFSFLMNAYGISSITPIKGIAVPFLSYGGSSLIAASIGVGLVLMISKRSKLS
jgi:cell division protein FtsW